MPQSWDLHSFIQECHHTMLSLFHYLQSLFQWLQVKLCTRPSSHELLGCLGERLDFAASSTSGVPANLRLLISLLALFSSFSSDGLDELYIIACALAITAGLSSTAYRILCIAATICSKLQVSKSDICHSIKLMQKTFLDKRLYMASKIWLDKRFDCSRWILISRWISGNIGFQQLYIRTMYNFYLCLATNNWHPSC